MSQDRTICLLGFGEVGQTLAADLAPGGAAQWTERRRQLLACGGRQG